jgi:hypothetical protein
MTFQKVTPSKFYVNPSTISVMTNRILTLLLLLAGLLFNTGCFNANPDDQELPWSRPAEWEGGVPGLGG